MRSNALESASLQQHATEENSCLQIPPSSVYAYTAIRLRRESFFSRFDDLDFFAYATSPP